MKAAETYRRHARDLRAFGDALNSLLEVLQRTEGLDFMGYPGPWVPRPGQEVEAGRRRAAVDMLTGRAAYAVQAAGVFVQWKPSGTFQTVPLNPAAEWSTIINPDPRFDADTIFACVRQALGILDMKAEEAAEAELRPARPAARKVAGAAGYGLRPLARWAVAGAGTVALLVVAAGVTYWLGWT
jgi:hypothetical protein